MNGEEKIAIDFTLVVLIIVLVWIGPAESATHDHHAGIFVDNAGSGCCPFAAKPFIESDVAEARLAQRHERTLLDPAAVVSGLGIAHDLTRVVDRLQMAGDKLVERRSFRAGDLEEPFRGAASATSARIAATSSAAMGWNVGVV